MVALSNYLKDQARNEFRWKIRKIKKHVVNFCAAFLFIALAAVGFPATTHALPTDGVIVNGDGTYTVDGNTLNFQQFSDYIKIHWGSFDTDVNEIVNFFQPGASSVAINKIIGGLPTVFKGILNANGNVYVMNDAGITFYGSSQVNVGSLIATTAKDVTIGPDGIAFTGEGVGEVINHGDIAVSQGGFAVLAAPYVENTGNIVANLGQVHLASTNNFTVDFKGDGLITYTLTNEALEKIGVVNTGNITAKSGIVNISTHVASDIVKSVVNLDGVIDADAFAANQDGGKVLISSRDHIVNNATITADAGVSGNGGTIHTEAGGVNIVMHNASLSATGGEQGGDGGNINIIGSNFIFAGDADASAVNGEAGTLFLDPDNLIIADGENPASDGSEFFDGDGFVGIALAELLSDVDADNFIGIPMPEILPGFDIVYEKDIEALSQGGTNVELAANESITLENLSDNELTGGAGDIILVTTTENDADPTDGLIKFKDKKDAITTTSGDIVLQAGKINIGHLQTGGDGVIDPGSISLSTFDGGKISTKSLTVTGAASSAESISGLISVQTGPGAVNIDGDITVDIYNSHASGTAEASVDIVGNNVTIDGDIVVKAEAEGSGEQTADADLNIAAIGKSGSVTIVGDIDVSATADASGPGPDIIEEPGGVFVPFGDGQLAALGGGLQSFTQPHAFDGPVFGGPGGSGGNGPFKSEGNAHIFPGPVIKPPVPQPGIVGADADASISISANKNVTIEGNINAEATALTTYRQSTDGGHANASALLDIDAGLNENRGGDIVLDGDVTIIASAGNLGASSGVAEAIASADLDAHGNISITTDDETFIVAANARNNNLNGVGTALASANLNLEAEGDDEDQGDISIQGPVVVDAKAISNADFGSANAIATAQYTAADDITINGDTIIDAASLMNADSGEGSAGAEAYLEAQAAGQEEGGPANINVTGDIHIDAMATNLAEGGVVNALAYTDLAAKNNITIITGEDTININAVANNSGSESSGQATATAYVDMEAGAEGAFGNITVNGPIVVNADADNVAANGAANAVAYVEQDANNNITVTDDITISADANNNASHEASADASAYLAMQAGFDKSKGGGSIAIGGDLDIDAVADNNAFSGDANANAYAELDAKGNFNPNKKAVSIQGPIDIAAMATTGFDEGSSHDRGFFGNGEAFAQAYLDIDAGNAIFPGDISIFDTIDVSAQAVQQGGAIQALQHGSGESEGSSAEADAWIDIVGFGDISINGDILVNAIASAFDNASATASIDIATGGQEDESGSVDENVAVNQGFISIFGDITASADADTTGGSGLAYALASVDIDGAGNTRLSGSDIFVVADADAIAGDASAYADLSLDAGNSLSLNGNILVDANAQGEEDAYASAEADLNADGGVTVLGNMAINATAAGENNDESSHVQAYADLNIGNESNVSNINLVGNTDVIATAQSGGFYGAYASASAELYADDNITINGNLTITGDVDAIDGSSYATAYAYLYAYAGEDGSGDLTINGNTILTADALHDGTNGESGEFANYAFASASAELYAANDVTINGNVSVDADAVMENGNDGASGAASAYAYLDIEAGGIGEEDEGDDHGHGEEGQDQELVGNLTITGDVTVDANAQTVGTGAFASASADLAAVNDVTINTDETTITVAANAVQSADSSEDESSGSASAFAYLNVNAGETEDGTADGSVSITGNIDVSADANNAGSAGNASALASANIGATNNTNILGAIDIAAMAINEVFFEGSADASALLSVNAGVEGESGDLDIAGNTTVSADASNTGSNMSNTNADVQLAAANNVDYEGDIEVISNAFNDGVGAISMGTLNVNAGNEGTFPGSISLIGDISVDADATVINNGFANADAHLNLIATNNIDITTGEDTVSVTADANAPVENPGPITGTAVDADASFLAQAGVGEGSEGSFASTGNIEVIANGNTDGAVFATGQAAVNIDINAADDVTINGDTIVTADVFNSVFSLFAPEATASADASLSVDAGNNATINGDITVTANAEINKNSEPEINGVGSTVVNALLDIDAGNNVTISTGDETIIVSATSLLNNSSLSFLSDITSDVDATIDIDAGTDVTIDGNVILSAIAEENMAQVDGFVDAQASLTIDAGLESESGSIDVTSDITVTADADSDGTEGSANAGAQVAFNASNNINYTGDMTITSEATANGGSATTNGLLDIDAGNVITIITGEDTIIVSANATGNGDSTDADAQVDIDAGNDVTLTGNVDVTADADNESESGVGSADALASLNVNAGAESESGSIDVEGDINVDAGANSNGSEGSAAASAQVAFNAVNNVNYEGDVSVISDAIANGFTSASSLLDIDAGDTITLVTAEETIVISANAISNVSFGSADATAEADIDAGSNISLDGNVDITANAENSEGEGSGSVDANAILTVDAGVESDSGSIAITSDINVTADANSNGSEGSASASGQVIFTAANNVNYTGDMNILSDASVNSGVSIANSTLDIDAGDDITLVTEEDTIVVSVSALNNGSGLAQAAALGGIDAGTDVSINGNLQVNADAEQNESESEGSANAEAILTIDAGVESESGSIDVTSDIVVTADVDSDGTEGSANANAQVAFNAVNNVNYTGDMSVLSDASGNNSTTSNSILDIDAGDDITLVTGEETIVVSANSLSGGTFGSAQADATMDVDAGNDVVVTGNVDITADAGNESEFFGFADAEASLTIDAGVESDSGSIAVTSDINVAADANSAVSSGSASANAILAFNAVDTIDYTGDASVISSISANGGFIASNSSASFNAGDGITIVTGEETITVSANADNNGSFGFAQADAEIDINAGGDVNLTGNVELAADAENNAEFGGSASANGNIDVTAGNDVAIEGDISVDVAAFTSGATSDTEGSDFNLIKLVFGGDAGAAASVNIQAGDEDNTGNLDIIGNVAVNVDATNSGAGGAQADAEISYAAASDLTLEGNTIIVSNAFSNGSGFNTANGEEGEEVIDLQALDLLDGSLSANATLDIVAGISGSGDVLMSGDFSATANAIAPNAPTEGLATALISAAGDTLIIDPSTAAPIATANGSLVQNVISDFDSDGDDTSELIFLGVPEEPGDPDVPIIIALEDPTVIETEGSEPTPEELAGLAPAGGGDAEGRFCTVVNVNGTRICTAGGDLLSSARQPDTKENSLSAAIKRLIKPQAMGNSTIGPQAFNTYF